MGRQYVHLSDQIELLRSSTNVYIELNVSSFLEDGNKLYRAHNGVICTEYIDPKYFKSIIQSNRKNKN